MSNIKKITLDGIEYTLEKMYPLQRGEIFFELAQVTDGAIEKFEGLNVSNISKMISGLIKKLEPKKTAELMKRIIQESVEFPDVSNDKNYDVHFQEYYEHHFVLIPEILSHNSSNWASSVKKKFPLIGKISKLFLKTRKTLTEELNS